MATITPKAIAETWLDEFNVALSKNDVNAIVALFDDKEAYLKDLLTFTWDFRTLHNAAIKEYLSANLTKTKLSNVKLDEKAAPAEVKINDDIHFVMAFFNFETDVARGRGVVRLVQRDTKWKAYTLYFGIEELKGHEEKFGAQRKLGVSHGENVGRKAWVEERAALNDFTDEEPDVVIVGAGQGGLSLAARLGQLGVKALIVDKNNRVGDNWRNRYKFLVLHDPVWYDHMPYIPFPPHWPVFTPKDKLGDWLESYASSMELNVWMKSTISGAQYDEASKKWSLNISRDGTLRELHPRYVIMATGHSGKARIPTFKGQEKFKGTIAHSSQHTTGKVATGKKAVVVGCCNSGHDIAHDFYEQGADVTIVQRSSTYVMSSENGLGILFKGLYDEDGPPTEDADIMFSSTPNRVHQRIHMFVTQLIAQADKPLLDGLKKAGFKLDFGDDGSGFLMKYFKRGGGYYLDVGASSLIADGKIKIKQGQEIDHFDENGIVFADGSRLDASTVVLATGYDNMKTSVGPILGKDVEERCNEVWGLDEENELKTMWRLEKSGHPGVGFMGGNLALCRFMSKRLALQIKAELEGLKK